MPASRKLAEFVSAFQPANAPDAIVRSATDVIQNTVGVAIPGSREESAHLIQGMAKAEAGEPRATVINTRMWASPQLAALSIGVASHAMDYDFTYMRAQSVAPLVPAILALGEAENSTPAQVVDPFIVGAEVSARFVRANQDGPMFDGWHTARIVRVMSAAAACTKLLNKNANAVSYTLGIAASLASGVTANFAR